MRALAKLKFFDRRAARQPGASDVKPGPTMPAPGMGGDGLALVRLRLRLALVASALVPFAALQALQALESTQSFQLPLVGVLVLLVVVVGGLVVWMSRQVLRPATELDQARDELRRMFEEARQMSLQDGLTGLGNHRAFQEELDRQMEWHRRHAVPFALLLIDLDDLKLVNDSQGHIHGDRLLRDFGQLIKSYIRYTDRAFRIGGDEFAVLLPHSDPEAALKLGTRLLEEALQPDQGRVPVSFSGGISAVPALASTREELYVQADAALYWCKRHGRGAIDVFDPVRDRAVDEVVSSESAHLARVIAGGLLSAAYQPVVDLRTGTVIGYEGLTRPLPESGYSNPGELFAAADHAGRTVELDYACAETVIAQSGGLAPEQMLSVNLSPRTLEGPQFSAEWLVALGRAHGLEPERLIVELTEHENIEDLPRLQRNLLALQRSGVRIAIDDLGAGNAGLRLLSQFRFDIVKVDLSLVQNGAQHDSSRAVLTSLRDLAARWGSYVVAEGLETIDQLRVVRELGLAAGQGYLLGRPMAEPGLRSVDLAGIEAGALVMEVRRPVLRPGPALPGPILPTLPPTA
ncbi:MAG TPA: EAL domain-containing protein [Candidatus Limnocylindrales bacterium]|nr:EAL domain-containing protein [Candidatus Limnocylindrales bacterium]